jgi:glycosyltransferase involved in cell wall biosynthesis
MRIAFLHGAALPSRAASTVQVTKMCAAFEACGHTVHLIVPSRRDIEPGVTDVFSFYGIPPLAEFSRAIWPEAKGGSYLSALHMACKARAWRADLVFSRFIPAAYFAALLGLPLIHEVHRPVSHASRFEQHMFAHLSRSPRLRHVIAISQRLRSTCEREVPDLAGRVLVVHDGADPVAEVPPVIASYPRRLAVGYVGSLNPGKGAEMLLLLAARYPAADFHVIGGNDEAVRALRDRAVHLRNVSIHGFLPHAEATRRMQTFDVLLAPYGTKVGVHGDSSANIADYMSPLKLFEYMAAGKAIVCADLDVLREVLTHGETGLLCPPGDVDRWLTALIRLDTDRQLVSALGERAREVFLEKYTWAARARSVLGDLGCKRLSA